MTITEQLQALFRDVEENYVDNPEGGSIQDAVIARLESDGWQPNGDALLEADYLKCLVGKTLWEALPKDDPLKETLMQRFVLSGYWG